MLNRIFSYFSLILSVVGATCILFLLANLAAAYQMERQTSASPNGLFNWIVGPQTAEGLVVFRRMFGATSDAEALSRHALAPSFEMHPGLHYMTARTNNAHYHMGLEGIRYESGWSDDQVKRFLVSSSTFMFGGSTVMGHGVSHDETIAHYWNGAAGDGTALNFGSQAYDFQRAAEKLAYLLRIGYRPKRAIFLIGWNELVGSARSNMRWQDKVIYHGFSANRGEIAYTNGTTKVNYLRLMADALPVVQYLRAKQHPAAVAVNPNRDLFTDGFDFREAHRLFNDWETFAVENRALLHEHVFQSLKAHAAYVKGLGRAFGFEVAVVLQPMGLFDPTNPFVTERARNTPGYEYLRSLHQDIRGKIANRDLEIIDGSTWLDALNTDRYVDVAHYSPASNRILAETLSRVTARSAIR